jgi:hypothetical protein
MDYSVLVMRKRARAAARPESDDRKTEAEQRQAADEQVAAPLLELRLMQWKTLRDQGGSTAEDQADRAQNEEHRGLRLPNWPVPYPMAK